jgi:formate dehydrogenase major subunit/formate dehydrogenase alpha subunit
MSNSMDDVAANASLFFVIGSNTTEQHPVFGTMIRRAIKFRGAKLIVADPRRIDLADFATLHLRQRPGTDIALINGLMYILLEKGLEDKAFVAERCEGFDEFKQTVMQYPPEKVAEITGVSVDQLYQAAEMMGALKPMAVMWAMGITQHIVGVRNVMDLANLQMLLGNMGVPGGGVNPLRGQNNVQGACDMGGLPNVFPAYQAVANEDVRRKFAEAWGVMVAGSKVEKLKGEEDDLQPATFQLSDRIGLTVTEMMPGILEGKIRALYILGEDPVMSDPDTNHIRRCLEALDFFVLQEIFPSETSQYADVLLPGVSFAEKTGTFTNTERRVQMVRQAIPPLGEARQDWQITSEIARRIIDGGQRTEDGYRKISLDTQWAKWNYNSPEDIMTEINALTPSYAGVTHARLDRGERLQWPVLNTDHPGTPILHTKGFTRGKGKFMPIDYVPAPELPDDAYPMILSTGRVLYHWHGGEMTRRAKGLLEVYGNALIEVNPEDAVKLGLDEGPRTMDRQTIVNGLPSTVGQRLRVTSRRGSIVAEAWITDRVPPGMVYANFHFPEASANELTIAALDPVSKIPSYKVCAVRVEGVGR